MAPSRTKLWKVIRALAYLYIIGVGVYWFTGTTGDGRLNLAMIALAILVLLSWFINRPMLEKAMGLILMSGSVYMLITVVDAYMKWNDRGHHTSAVTELVYGSIIFGLGFVAGSALVVIAYLRRISANNNR